MRRVQYKKARLQTHPVTYASWGKIADWTSATKLVQRIIPYLLFFNMLKTNRKILYIISPTHKRTEGHAPVWGSKFITEVTPKGGSTEFAVRLNVGFWVLDHGVAV